MKDLSTEDFKTLRKGVYYVISSKKKMIADTVFIFQGRCIDSKFGSIISSLKQSTLQKFREITLDEESAIEEKFKLHEVIVKRKEKTEETKKKKTESEMRRDYFDSFDKGSQAPKKKYTIRNSLARLLG
jgi:chromatin remodeling complex protein RSC6